MALRLAALVVTVFLSSCLHASELRVAELHHLRLPNETANQLQGSDKQSFALKSRTSVCDRHSRRAAMSGCAICNMAPLDRPTSPTMYVEEREDGCGARLQEIISWAGVAERSKLKFGGVISSGVCQQSHGADIFRAVSAVLGLESPDALFTEFPPKFDRTYKSLSDFHTKFANGDKIMSEYVPNGNILVQDNCLECKLQSNYNYSEFLSPKLLSHLRSESKLGGLYANMRIAGRQENRPVVALHVRRGDLRPGYDTHPPRFLNKLSPNGWYYVVVNKILKLLPNADVHVFSSTESLYHHSDFQGFRQRKMTVHLDGDILDDWAVMANAEVFVMAKSAFSYIPAFLNTGCILFQPWEHKKPALDEWILARDANGTDSDSSSHGTPFFDVEELARCLHRVKSLRQM